MSAPSVIAGKSHDLIITLLTYFALIFLLNNRNLLRIACLLFFFLGLAELGNYFYANSSIESYFWLAMFSTSPSESSQFLGALNMWWWICGPLWLILYASVDHKFKQNTPKTLVVQKTWMRTLSIVLIFVIFSRIETKYIENSFPYNIFYSYVKADAYVKSIKLPSGDIKTEITEKPAAKTIVLVLGESASASRFSLYGYHRDTNPYLSKRNDLIIYQNVFSTGLNTQPNVKTIFSGQVLQGHEHPVADIFKVAKKANFKVLYADNNKYQNVDPIYLMARQSDEYVSINGAGETSTESDNRLKLDELLYEPYEKFLQNTAENKLIILHTAGSHPVQQYRYPAKFELLSNHYDNSVLYTDFLVNSFIDMLQKKENGKSVMFIYLSDHGVALPPGCNLGENTIPDWNAYGANNRVLSSVKVPLMFWTSPEFAKHNKMLHEKLTKNVEHPIDNRFIYYTLAQLMGVTKVNGNDIKQLSIFNDDAAAFLPRLNTDQMDMDLAVKTGEICTK